MSELLSEVESVMRTVFGDDEITLTETSTAEDVDGWDSLMHLNLIIALEQRYSIKFTTAEISELKEEGQNVGGLLAMITAKRAVSG